jgi:hypothetical protein
MAAMTAANQPISPNAEGLVGEHRRLAPALPVAAHVWEGRVEVIRDDERGVLDEAAVERLGAMSVAAMVDGDRYTVVFRVFGADVAEASRSALGHWWHLVETARLPAWEPVQLTLTRAADPPVEPPRIDPSQPPERLRVVNR